MFYFTFAVRTFGSLYFAFGPRAAIKGGLAAPGKKVLMYFHLCAHTCRIVCLEFREHLGAAGGVISPCLVARTQALPL